MDNEYDSPAMQEKAAYEMTRSLGGGSLRTPPVRKVVEQRILELEKQVAAHKDLLAALDSNPGVEAVLDKLRKIGI